VAFSLDQQASLAVVLQVIVSRHEFMNTLYTVRNLSPVGIRDFIEGWSPDWL